MNKNENKILDELRQEARFMKILLLKSEALLAG